MKKALLAIAACMLSFHIATAQEKPQVKRADPQTSDLFKVLEEGQETPLVLYASAWVDKEYKFIRFCGEMEIDPEMKAQILTHVPHYYIFGLKFQKVCE